MEMRLCELLHKTPSEIGEIRRKSPLDIAFLEQHIVYEYKEREKAHKEAERKAKSKRGRKH